MALTTKKKHLNVLKKRTQRSIALDKEAGHRLTWNVPKIRITTQTLYITQPLKTLRMNTQKEL